MSAAQMGRATWLQGVSCTEKMILVAILDVADDTGLAYLLIETIMAKSSCSRRTVQIALASLEEKGLLRKRTRRNRSSIFKVTVSRLPLHRPKEISEKEMSEDHFWDNDRGASNAPQDELPGLENAADARGGAYIADESAADAPILPVIHPVISPVLPPISPEPLSDSVVASMFVDRWNAMAERVDKISSITKLGDKRKASLLARIDDYERARDPKRVGELIDRVIKTIEGSLFLRGEKKDFKATPDWALTPKYFPKLEETGYVQDAADDYRAPIQPGERDHIAAGLAARDALRASGGTARRSPRETAGGAARRAPRTY